MGGNRPNQHNIDSGEAGSGDSTGGREGRNQGERIAEGEHEHKEVPRGRDGGGMTADERVDEASEESFPASDPPAQP
jgi:hypothetical protein